MSVVLLAQGSPPDLDEWLRDRVNRWFGGDNARRRRAAAFSRDEPPEDDDNETERDDDSDRDDDSENESSGANGRDDNGTDGTDGAGGNDSRKRDRPGPRRRSRSGGPGAGMGGMGGMGGIGGIGAGMRRPGAGGGSPPLRLVGTVAGAALLFLYVLAGFFTVDASERAVMFRLGAPAGIKGPGLKWHIPLVENYQIVNLTEVRRVEVGYRNSDKNKVQRESLMLTGNLNIIDTQFVVQYALNDPESFLFENRFSGASAEDVVQQVAETAMREVVGKSNIDFVLYEGREAVAADAKTLMQDILNRYKAGIEIREVAVRNVQPPDQVQAAFEDAIKARQDRDRKINEGEAYANRIIPRARGQAARVLEEAEGYKQGIVARASGEADRFLLLAAEYAKAPEVTRRRLYLEAMEEVMGRANKLLVDDSGSNNLIYLPLDKMMGAAAAGAIARELEEGELPPDGVLPDPNDPTAGGTLEDFKDRLRRRVEQGAQALEQLERRQ